MPIETICQGCARKLRVPDEHAGKKARCPQCGMIYVVPSSPDASSPAIDPASPETPARTDSGPDDIPSSAASPFASNAASAKQERWQVRTNDGRVYGPVPKYEVDQWFSEGRIPANATLLREGDSQWRNAADVYPQLASGRRKIDERNNPFSELATPHGVRRTPTVPRRYQAPHRGGLILVLAILGWAICPVLGPFAWAMGSGDLRQMQAGQMDPSGQGLTQAGMILGIIQTILMLVGVFFMCIGGLAG